MVVETLRKTLPTKRLGDLTWYMGVEYQRDKEDGVIVIRPTSYIRTALGRFDVSRSTPFRFYVRELWTRSL